MKAQLISVALLASTLFGCTLFTGEFHRRSSRVILVVHSPAYYPVDADGHPGEVAGVVERMKGDTLKTLGEHFGPGISHYYLIGTAEGEVFIEASSVRTLDEHLYLSLGSKFQLASSEDPAAWARATVYISRRAPLRLEISSNTLIQTIQPEQDRLDSTAIAYLVTRVPLGRVVEYEIRCTALHRFDPDTAATRLAFYMVTGRHHD